MTGVNASVAGATPPPAETPAPQPAGPANFSWDAIVQRLREITAGEYEILTELGRGGMAAVFLAHEFALNRKVALKVMSPSVMLGRGMIERFYSEAVTQANLQHPHIVGVHAVRNESELHFFVMQYVAGRTLQSVLRSEVDEGRSLSLPVVRALLYQAGSALAYAHRRGVIHRDVKPGNIILNGDGDAVVTDFGIAKVTEAPSQTMTGTVVGTPAYMSPEQCFAFELTPASDQYSLGVVAYELMAGKPPFEGPSFVVMQAHTTREPPPITEARPDCPPDFAAAVTRMMAKKAEDRFADLDEALHALGAHAPHTRSDDPLRRELQRLADVKGVEEKLADVLRGPLSPMPRTRSGSSRAISGQGPGVAGPTGQPGPPSDHSPRPLSAGAQGSGQPTALPPSPVPSSAPLPQPAAEDQDVTAAAEPGSPRRAIRREPAALLSRRRRTRRWIAGAGLVATAGITAVVIQARPALTPEVSTTQAPLDSATPPSPGAQVGQPVTPPPEAEKALPRAAAPPPRPVAESTAPPPRNMPARREPTLPKEAEKVIAAAESTRALVPVPPTGGVTAPTNPAGTPPPVMSPPVIEKTEAELTAEAERTIAELARLISTRDTAQIRRGYPTASAQYMGGWQSVFEEANEQVQVSVLQLTALDRPSGAQGSTARFRVQLRIALRGRGYRGPRTQDWAPFVATLRRDSSGWVVAAIGGQ